MKFVIVAVVRSRTMDEHEELDRHFITTFRWLDRGGEPRTVEVYSEHKPDARVWAYARDDSGALHLVGAVRADGKFYHLVRDKAATLGLDTEAAWNDLFQICWAAHMPSTPMAWRG